MTANHIVILSTLQLSSLIQHQPFCGWHYIMMPNQVVKKR